MRLKFVNFFSLAHSSAYCVQCDETLFYVIINRLKLRMPSAGVGAREWELICYYGREGNVLYTTMGIRMGWKWEYVYGNRIEKVISAHFFSKQMLLFLKSDFCIYM